jgi:phosphatidylinositol alpha-1,6-mannosyltransferase
VDLFLADSRFTWQRFTQAQPQCVDRPHQIVPRGCEQPAPKSLPPAGPPAALLLGRMMRGEDYKGHRELIAVWPAVRARIPEARLWIAGDGDLQPELQGLADRLGLQDSVQFWGRVSEEQKQELLDRCRCLAMPSRGEGFGLVYLEAMRRGRPCLVSNCDAGQEVVQPPEAGLAVDPKDAPALTDAVCRLLTPGAEWEQWSQAARRRYEEHYTAAQYRRRLLQALFDINS